jgi:hypothetical protein
MVTDLKKAFFFGGGTVNYTSWVKSLFWWKPLKLPN